MVKKTVIIGGASGIGFAVSGALAEQGESLILAGRDSGKRMQARDIAKAICLLWTIRLSPEPYWISKAAR